MKNSHSFSELKFHLVLVTRFRHDFPLEAEDYLEMENVISGLNLDLLELTWNKNHFHILFEMHPYDNISNIVMKVKSMFSMRMQQRYISWPCFQTGYYCASVGKSELNIVQNYINSQ